MLEDTNPSPVKSWLLDAARQGASDLHLVEGYPPILRLHSQLVHMDHPGLSSDDVLKAMRCLCAAEMFSRFEKERNLDIGLELDSADVSESESTPDGAGGLRTHSRFRANFFYSGEHPGACVRVIPTKIPDFHWTNFPEELADQLASYRNGLVLFSGVTGSGKTTSMALLIKMLSERGGMRIVTIEDPIEYRFAQNDTSVISQREVGRDVGSFAEGLKFAMRQDPDIILVGEIRDSETARMALSAAETGHLVLSTLHTRDAKGAITRLVDLFPDHSQSETRAMLAIGLRAVVSQHLLPSSLPGEKRELALEVMLNSNPVAAAIRSGRIDSLDNVILTSRREGMYPLDESIKRLLMENRISDSVAERFISDKNLLR